MSTVFAEPEVLTGAAGELMSINAVMRAGTAAAAGPTTSVVPAASDLVSLMAATQFTRHATLFQEIAAHAVSVQEQLALTLGVSGASYGITEASNAASVG